MEFLAEGSQGFGVGFGSGGGLSSVTSEITDKDPGMDYVSMKDKLRGKASFMDSGYNGNSGFVVKNEGGEEGEGEGELMYSDSFEFENFRKGVDLIDPVKSCGEGNTLDSGEVGGRFRVKDLPGLDMSRGATSGYNTIQESLYEESSSSLGGERPGAIEI
jgi:hypothetical protein